MATKVVEITTEEEIWIEALEIKARPFVNIDAERRDSGQQTAPIRNA